MDVSIQCNNSFQCWECEQDCLTKKLFVLDDTDFMAILHDSLSQNIGFMMVQGIPMEEAEKIQQIKTMSLITARMKYLKLHH